MENQHLINWKNFSWLFIFNQSYIENLYNFFLIDPNSVTNTWRIIFNTISENKKNTQYKKDILCNHNIDDLNNIIKKNKFYIKSIKILELIDAFRRSGHKIARINPLNLFKKENIPNLTPQFYNLTEKDLQDFSILKKINENKKYYISSYTHLKNIYSNSIGFEYMHISNTNEKEWIQNYIESINYNNFLQKKQKYHILKKLTHAEMFEKFLAIKFPGSKRFSLEGSDTLIPMLDFLIGHAKTLQISDIFFGMAHRGRLNVLVNIFKKKARYVFQEFLLLQNDILHSGDVKYHMGYESKNNNHNINLKLQYNPSHLEIINPVVMGSTRAHMDSLQHINNNNILSIMIHGDAAISGQGIIQETLNMSQVPAYNVGGSIHLVINNQIGFTTSNKTDLRSSYYCTDIAKMIESPVFHVNADDPEAAIFSTKLALDYRKCFKKDVFIDLICYRRHGHNETDDPYVTQPTMYQKINHHPSTRNIYANFLKKNNAITLEDDENIQLKYKKKLDNEYLLSTEKKNNKTYVQKNIQKKDINYYHKINFQTLKNLAISINTIPNNIIMHPRVKNIYNNRLKMIDNKQLFDWGAAENLAYATIITQGVSCRLSGEDVGRGTFFHRHAVIHNQKNDDIYVPLKNIKNSKGKFYIWDSVLSEESALAFEYGYSCTNNMILTIWEAQFGDFANVAQVVIDQFISSGEEKWGYKCGLVLLLPHGYEGQGPEHSSARLERYLQLSAEKNMQITIPTKAAQIYHILQRQAFQKIKKPLIIMSPKSLLRHPLALSSFSELLDGHFQEIIDEIDIINKASVTRIIFCAGKIYYDLLNERRKIKNENIAIIRIEQLYPFPKLLIMKILDTYSYITDYIWCQEEPLNQGAWNYIQHVLSSILPIHTVLKYIGRPAAASPAVGYFNIHEKQQKKIIDQAIHKLD